MPEDIVSDEETDLFTCGVKQRHTDESASHKLSGSPETDGNSNSGRTDVDLDLVSYKFSK